MIDYRKKKVCLLCPRSKGPQPLRVFVVFGKRFPNGRIHAYCRIHRKIEADRTNKENADAIKYAARQWAKANPDPVKVSKMNYRARERYGATEVITLSGWQQAKKFAGYKCLKCGSPEQLVPDHIVPLSKGGRNINSNIAVLCNSCNSSKQDRGAEYYAGTKLEARLAQAQKDTLPF